MTTRTVRRKWSAAHVCATAMAVLPLISGCALQPNENTLPGQVATGDDGYSVTVHFDAVENLVPNSQVLLDDVVVGTVASIEVEDWHAVANIRLLDSMPISSTARFTIGQKTLLGAQYVDVDNPAATTGEVPSSLLAEGDEVPLARTGRAPATEQVLAGVALLLNNGGLSQISTITGELTTALDERELDTRDLVTRSNELLGVLDDTKGEIVRALESLNRLSKGLAGDRNTIARAIDRIGPGLEALEEERARLVDAVTTSGRASTRAVGVIQASQEAILANLDALGPVLSNLGKAATRVPEALKIAITIPFPAMTTEDTLRGDYSNLFATIDVSNRSLVDLLLGTDQLPSLQSEDPVTGPIEEPRTESKADKGTRGGASGGDADQGADGTNDSGGLCLLQLLGDC
ncbi:MlaD family protein [Nocardioides sp.]|uniref:MlaD family protein n=1 Tax=Nocardioides sp. TaxID=35761 RepID=UPI002B2694C7|nr:MlaD family protein [Nocardioides sp.]